MKFQLAALAAALLSLFPHPGTAQTASELLQRGIYTQRTVGHPDEAIAIYRQVIASAGADRATAARAQMLIVAACLGKGDAAGAAREFSILTTNYGDQKDAISAVVTALQLAPEMRINTPAIAGRPGLSLGKLENGVYRHTATSTEIRIPAGWSAQMDGHSSGGGDAVFLINGTQNVFVYMKSRTAAVEEIPSLLDKEIDYKWHQRKFDEGNESYKERPGTRTRAGTGVRQSESVAFDLVQGTEARIEYGTWILTPNTLVYLRSFGVPSSIDEMARAHNAIDAATVAP
jgi:hypothetical protein